MFIDFQVVKSSLQHLRRFHPFFGITFLVCKKAQLPIGKSTSFAINAAEESFLKTYYKPDISSKYFFQPFRTSSRVGPRLSPKYPSSGSQSTRTRGDFEKAFVHDKNTDQWGWSKNYVRVLKDKLETDGQVILHFGSPFGCLERESGRRVATPSELIAAFFAEFLIGSEEISNLFDQRAPSLDGPFLTEIPYSDAELLRIVNHAPDDIP